MSMDRLLFLAPILYLSACANAGQMANSVEQIPITTAYGQANVGEGGAVFLWPPYSSAAIIDGKGNRCILAASGAKTNTISAESAFKLGKALDKIEGLEASTKSNIIEAFKQTSAPDARSALVDISLFHLCILDENGTFRDWPDKKSQAVLSAYLQTVALVAGGGQAPKADNVADGQVAQK